jgi:primosomal protein N' (replication factor Y)
MRYYEVLIASGSYHASSPLTYSSEEPLEPMSVVTVPLKARMVTGFVLSEVDKPSFSAKPIKSTLSKKSLPPHCFELAQWISKYYASNLSDGLRQFAPSKPTLRKRLYPEDIDAPVIEQPKSQLGFEMPLTNGQKKAIDSINNNPSTTALLHGHTGTGKTRVYLELARNTIARGKSIIILTPEIALTSQLTSAIKQFLNCQVLILHSRLTQAERKKIWLNILESEEPVVVVGPRSALFSPVHNLGLIILDEAHEPAYKQEQSPRYHASRVASQLGLLTGAKVVLGTATPNIADYYLAKKHSAIVLMTQPAVGGKHHEVKCQVIDLKERQNFASNPYLSNQLIDAIKSTISAKKQVMIYLNRRGSARLILCKVCGWQLLCPNCDIPLTYHGDSHSAQCHICGHSEPPPNSCPSCGSPDIIYKSIGTKTLADMLARLFPSARLQRFDSDNIVGEHLNELYAELHSGNIDILVGTQLLAKGLDLPRLGLVGIISAETSLALPDFSSEERSFQLLYQVIGRVGRGHVKGEVVVQSYDPQSLIVNSAINRDYETFYEYSLLERQKFRFPPFSYLLQLTCRRATIKGVEQASNRLLGELAAMNLPVELIGPSPSFYARRGKYYYYQIVVKSKDREHLLKLAEAVPQDWTINLDPSDLI